MSTTKVNNPNLQLQLTRWVEQVRFAATCPYQSKDRELAIVSFCRSFVPSDVSEDDVQHFSGNLINDAEYFQSLCRDLEQCESGYKVESIVGDQRSRATFTLLPPDGLLSEQASFDLVREVSYISTDFGENWTAEG